MRIDKYIDHITKRLFSPRFIPQVIAGEIPFSLRAFLQLINFKRRFMSWKRGPFQGLKNREGLTEYDIPPEALDAEHKKDGITALARLKNADEFLKLCVEALVPHVDEIILLVDTNSTDQTLSICEQLAQEYPDICKYFRYEPEVYPGNHPKYSATPDDSVHALSYFYNYCLAQASYRYVMKFDDDMLVIPEQFSLVANWIRIKKPASMIALPQINVSRDPNGRFAIATKYLHSGLAGMFGDHGIFPISRQSYFYNDVGCENLVMGCGLSYGPLSFLHLKTLKGDGGTKNYSGYGKQYVKDLYDGSDYIPLPSTYVDLLALHDIKD